MAHHSVDLTALDEFRETGDYEKLAQHISGEWQEAPLHDLDGIRLRLLAAELAGRSGRLDAMEEVLAPFLESVDWVPLGVAARVLLTIGFYYYRRNEPNTALRYTLMSQAIAGAHDDDWTAAEAIQLEGQALWSLERWDEAAARFNEVISQYTGQARSYRLGLAQLCLGGVLNRIGKVEEARTALERAIKVLLRCHDEYNLAVARVNVAQPLNAMGEHEMALKYLMFALETFQQSAHGRYIFLTLNSIAATLIAMRDFERAETYLERAIEAGAVIGSTQIAPTYEIKARMHLTKREYTAAEKALRTSLELSEQSQSHLQRAEARRTLGRLYLSQNRESDAAAALWEALDLAEELNATLLETEIKALLVQSICTTDPLEACAMLSDVEATVGDRALPELRKLMQAARKRINSLDQEHFFIISDAQVPLLADAKIALLKWLWARALHKARGNAREAAQILDVTPTYIRKLTKIIPRDMLRPGRKRQKKSAASV